MTTDARISAGLPEHPKTKKLIRKLGQAAAWNLVRLILWTAANRSDGDLSGLSSEDIEIVSDWAGAEGEFVSALAALHFIEGEPNAYRVHDWEEHNPWAAGAKRRSEAARANAARKWGVEPAATEQTNAQKRSARLAEARRKGSHTNEEWEAMKAICGNACVECGATDRELSKDHVLAVCKGGSDAIDNIQPMCHRCNASKGANGSDKRPENWRELLAEWLPNACETSADFKETPGNDEETSAPSPSPSPSPNTNTPPAGGWPGFDEFWRIWPKTFRKESKGKCLAAWKRAGAEALADQILAHVERLRHSENWTKQDGQFVPAPLVYLNNRRWEGADDPGQAPVAERRLSL